MSMIFYILESSTRVSEHNYRNIYGQQLKQSLAISARLFLYLKINQKQLIYSIDT